MSSLGLFVLFVARHTCYGFGRSGRRIFQRCINAARICFVALLDQADSPVPDTVKTIDVLLWMLILYHGPSGRSRPARHKLSLLKRRIFFFFSTSNIGHTPQADYSATFLSLKTLSVSGTLISSSSKPLFSACWVLWVFPASTEF